MPMETIQTGVGAQGNIQAQVDPSFQATRVNLRPLEFSAGGQVGGHFRMGWSYSSTAAKPAGGSDVVSLRWTDSKLLFVLKRLSVWATTTTTYTATANQDLALFKATGFTVSPSAGTQIIPSTISQKARTNFMSGSGLGGASGVIWASSGDLLTTGTRTLDTQFMGYAAYQNAITAANLPFQANLFEFRDFGQHPFVLSANEGLVVQSPIGNAQAAGVSKYAFVMDWAEVPAY